jgi:hypothetical protein
MRKCALLLFIGSALAAPLAGQSMLTLRVGANVATLGGGAVGQGIGSGESSTESQAGLNLGASLLIPISDNIGIQLGGAYSAKGAETDLGDISASVKLNYIEVPALVKMKILSAGSASAHVLLGPALAFLATCSTKASQFGATISLDCDESDIPVKSVDFGAMGGFGVDMEVSDALTLVLDLFYNFGLASIATDGADVKNRAFTIQAGVGFPIW